MFYRSGSNQIILNKDPDRNTLAINGTEFRLSELYEGSGTGKGGNSAVYLATPIHSVEDECVVKFCRFPVAPINRSHKKRIKRFKHEVEALKKAQKSNASEQVISLTSEGIIKLPIVGRNEKKATVAYYVMEKAECDLASFIYQNSLSLDAKLRLFLELAESLSKLHAIGIRHRDLKPDNIFICDQKIKLGDLGLIHDIEREYSLDGINEKIGPFGYMSPEAMNKALADHSRIENPESVVICEKSDIYQLGLILFYLVQGEVPMGCLEDTDFTPEWAEIPEAVSAVISMLQFRKERRIDLAPTLKALA